MSFKAIAIIVLASSFAVSAIAGPLEDAGAAERRDDCTTAVSIYRTLAEKGVVEPKRDWLQAAKWYGKAIDAGDQASAASLSHIGRNWRFMYRNAPMDPIIYELIEQAAKKGSAVAQFSLGVMKYPIGDPSFDPSKGNPSISAASEHAEALCRSVSLRHPYVQKLVPTHPLRYQVRLSIPLPLV
jgi:TPR repeat protein